MNIKKKLRNLVMGSRQLFRFWLLLLIPAGPVYCGLNRRVLRTNPPINAPPILLFAYGCKYGLWRIRPIRSG